MQTLRALSAADDDLHPPTTDDPFWTETAWFAFTVPERKLTVFSYPVFRTNLGVCSAGVFIWDDTAEADHLIRYSNNWWHVPMPTSLTDMTLPNGLSYKVLEPLRRYRVTYAGDGVSFDVTYTGLITPQLTPRGDHVDQPCHVTGELILHGETIAVDCYEMRDKSWHVRSDAALQLPPEVAHGSYTYAISTDAAFLAKTAGSNSDTTAAHDGFYWRDGTLARLIEGRRTVTRGDGRAVEIVVEATDELGRNVVATGKPFNRYAFRATPAILAWISGVEWTIDGVKLTGEDQEW